MEKKNNMSDKKIKVMIVKMLTMVERRLNELSNTFNKELENVKMNQSDMKNEITEIKMNQQ